MIIHTKIQVVDVELLVLISMMSKDQRVFNHFIVLTETRCGTHWARDLAVFVRWQVRRMSADIPLVADDSAMEMLEIKGAWTWLGQRLN